MKEKVKPVEMHPKPSAPPLLEVLKDEEVDLDYNWELGCDVEFLVGDAHVMRIPVHSHKLMQFPVFRAMFSNNFATGGREERGKMKQIPIEDVDGKSFDNLMRFIYGKPVNFQLQTVETVVETLKAAHKYLISSVVRACAIHLNKMISLGNVVWIYASVGYLCNDVDDLEKLTKGEPSQPFSKDCPEKKTAAASYGLEESKEFSDDTSAGLEIKRICIWLLNEVLTFIDTHARHVLLLDEIEQLEYSLIQFLLRRDSLDVSESVVFSALLRWAETQCKRQHLELTAKSKRVVLHDLLYLVRFFQMADIEFQIGPESSGLLTPEEAEIIRNMILHGQPHFVYRVYGDEILSPSPERIRLYAHWSYFSTPRTPNLNSTLRGTGNGSGDNSSFKRSVTSSKSKRRWGSLKGGKRSSNSVKFKGFFKDFRWRRNTDSNVNYQQYRNKDDSSQQQMCPNVCPDENRKERRSSGNGESTFTKAICVTVNIFAFFFD